jgi:2-keto-3-deoxy-L-rhamnonate aldolase RhmA
MKAKTVGWLAALAIGTAASAPAAMPQGMGMGRHNRLVDLLVKQDVVFGWIASNVTAEGARKAATDRRMDVVFITMESVQSYDPAVIRSFREAMLEAGLQTNPNTHPLAIRLPAFHDAPAAARQRVAETLNLGAHAIVFPAVETPEEASQAINAMRHAKAGVPVSEARAAGFGEAPAFWGMSDQEYEMRADVYPINRIGELASIFIIESAPGIANSRAITKLRPTVVIPGPALRAVMKGDMVKVEGAIQTQLAACKEFDVPCGITANATDVEKRIKEGFRVIVIDDRDYPETITIGRAAARR